MSDTWSKKTFAKNLKKYIELAGKNQKEVAAAVGVSAPTLNDWINEKKYPRIDKIQRLADYFGILKSDLIEEKMTVEKEKDNEDIANFIVRMRTDKEYYSIVKTLYDLDSDQIKGIASMLKALAK